MLTETQYCAIVENARGFSRMSLHYPDYEDHRHYEVLHDGADGVLLAEPSRDPSPVHWAASDAETLVSLLSLAPENITVPFVPREFIEPLTEAGLFVLAEFADFFNLHLMETVSSLAPRQKEFLNADEAEAAAALSVAVRGQSRGFMGETAPWFRAWMKEGHVLALREGKALAGICCVTVYNGGTTLWVRELAVSPSCQRRGYGRQLMEQALLYGAERGSVKAFLAADINNTNAIALYESCGFSRRGEDTELQMARGSLFQK